MIQSRNPSLLNILALLGVLTAVGWLLYPSAQHLYQRLDLRPAMVTVAVSATVATLLLSVVSIVWIQSTQAQYDATLNPTPIIVNAVLPDQASLARGQTLYDASCPNWAFVSVKELIEPRSRDENLFAAVRDGWRTLPACTALTDNQRWDIVNYLRTLKP